MLLAPLQTAALKVLTGSDYIILSTPFFASCYTRLAHQQFSRRGKRVGQKSSKLSASRKSVVITYHSRPHQSQRVKAKDRSETKREF
jgi:hypothetical protein